jgi:transcriptional regulator with XRE-family HTH domain
MLNNRLRKIRERNNLNQRQLAEACHTPQSLICAVEKGTKATWPKLTQRLCRILQVRPKEIFPYLVDKNEDTAEIVEAPAVSNQVSINGGDPTHGN